MVPNLATSEGMKGESTTVASKVVALFSPIRVMETPSRSSSRDSSGIEVP
jgi:hypothetical protein